MVSASAAASSRAAGTGTRACRSRVAANSIDSAIPSGRSQIEATWARSGAARPDRRHGPTEGTVTLPRHLDWSGHAEYDLTRAARLASMYKVVLTEASTVEDLHTWLDADLLRRLWATLWLPPQLRQRWEEAFPELAATRSNAA